MIPFFGRASTGIASAAFRAPWRVLLALMVATVVLSCVTGINAHRRAKAASLHQSASDHRLLVNYLQGTLRISSQARPEDGISQLIESWRALTGSDPTTVFLLTDANGTKMLTQPDTTPLWMPRVGTSVSDLGDVAQSHLKRLREGAVAAEFWLTTSRGDSLFVTCGVDDGRDLIVWVFVDGKVIRASASAAAIDAGVQQAASTMAMLGTLWLVTVAAFAFAHRRVATMTANLEERDARLRQAQTLAMIGDWSLDMETGALTWGSQTYRIFGVDEATFTPTLDAMFERVHPEDVASVRRYTRAEGGHEGRSSLSFRINLPDGEVRHVRAISEDETDDDGHILARVGTMQDITDAHLAERERTRTAVHRAKSVLELAQQIAHVGSWEWDIQSNRVTWSDEMYRIFGVDEDRTHARTDDLMKMVHVEDRPRLAAMRERGARDGFSEPVEYRIVLKDGSERTIRAKNRYFRDEQGNLSRIVGTVQDVTDQKQGVPDELHPQVERQ